MNDIEIDAALVINALRDQLAEAHLQLALANARITQLQAKQTTE